MASNMTDAARTILLGELLVSGEKESDERTKMPAPAKPDLKVLGLKEEVGGQLLIRMCITHSENIFHSRKAPTNRVIQVSLSHSQSPCSSVCSTSIMIRFPTVLLFKSVKKYR